MYKEKKGMIQMTSGWYTEDEYFVVKPLKNGHRQSLIIGAVRGNAGRWYIMAGVFSSSISYYSMKYSKVWNEPTSTNKNPSMNSVILALEALNEIEQVIHNQAKDKRAYIYVDGLDERRLHAYTRILTKKSNYKLSTVKNSCGLPLLYKRV